MFPRVHLDADDEARVAQESILQLAEAEELGFALVFCAGARLAIALVEHHLFAVMGPAFDVGVGAEDFADVAGRLETKTDTERSDRDRPRGPMWK